jgi:hypothetical protein
MPKEPAKPKPKVFGLGSKLVIGFTFVFTVLFVGAFYWFYVFSTERAIERILDDLEATVAGAAAGLDGASLARLFAEGEPDGAGGSDHPDYAAQLQWLQTVQSLEPRAWPYTYVAGSRAEPDRRPRRPVDPVGPAQGVRLREADVSLGSLTGGLTALTINLPRDRRCQATRSADPRGQPLGGLRARSATGLQPAAPRGLHRRPRELGLGLRARASTPRGSPRGAVGLDFELAHVDEVQNAILGSTGQAFLITLRALLLLVLVLVPGADGPIVRLTAAAERVGEGHYDEDFGRLRQRRFRDEIGVLADVFLRMTEKVDVREQTCGARSTSLRIEIDEGKRAQQVQEIVDTDFFRDLQARAQQMRNRQAKAGDAAT